MTSASPVQELIKRLALEVERLEARTAELGADNVRLRLASEHPPGQFREARQISNWARQASPGSDEAPAEELVRPRAPRTSTTQQPYQPWGDEIVHAEASEFFSPLLVTVQATDGRKHGADAAAHCEQELSLDEREGKLGSSVLHRHVRLQLWPIWKDDCSPEDADTDLIGRCSKVGSFSRVFDKQVKRTGDEVRTSTFLRHLIARPSSPRRICWDILIFVLMGWDVVMLPLFPFDLEETKAIIVMELVSTIFWTCDLIMSFLVGFHRGGLVEMRPAKIAKKYLRTWFPLDIFLLALDWSVVSQRVGEAGALFGLVRIGKALRVARILRMFRLLRMLKVMSLMSEFSDFIHSEAMLTAFAVFKLTIGIAVVNHFIACCWYGVGAIYVESGWIAHLEERDGPSTFGYRYSTALHWSLTQFTPASMEVRPYTTWERSFTICVIIFALVFFSFFLSSITSAMTRLRDMNVEAARQQEKVRQYITDNKVALELGNRIYGFLRQQRRNHQRRRVHEDDIPVFKGMPETLQVQLHAQVYLPTLLSHGLFARFQEAEEHGPASLCHFAMKERDMLVGAELFMPGEKASWMYFVLNGTMEYSYGPSESQTVYIKNRAHVSEMALWLQWEHVGRLTATSTCELVSLDCAVFRSIVWRTGCFGYIRAYAQLFAQRMRLETTSLESLSDLWGGTETLNEILHVAFEDKRRCPRSRTASKELLGLRRQLSMGREMIARSLSEYSGSPLNVAQSLRNWLMGRKPSEEQHTPDTRDAHQGDARGELQAARENSGRWIP